MRTYDGNPSLPISINSKYMEMAGYSAPYRNQEEVDISLDMAIETGLREHGIQETPELRRRIRGFATEKSETRGAYFVPVDEFVPRRAKWCSSKGEHSNNLTIDNKPVYFWIVGIVSSCHLHDGDDTGNPEDVSIYVKPFAETDEYLSGVLELPHRYGPPDQPLVSLVSDLDNAIKVVRSMLNSSDFSKATPSPFKNVFDGRTGYDNTTKTNAKRMSNKDITVGDVVLVEALFSRKPPPERSLLTPLPAGCSRSSSPARSARSHSSAGFFRRMSRLVMKTPPLPPSEQESYNVMYKLVDIILLAKRGPEAESKNVEPKISDFVSLPTEDDAAPTEGEIDV